jgi:GNAT superfamily N-acetyltransferase
MLKAPNVVRPASPCDIPALLELMRALAEFEGYADDFAVDENALLSRAFGQDPQCKIFVAEFHGRVSGYAVVLETLFTFDLRPTLVLKELYVADDCRALALGSALMRRVAVLARERGAGRLKWNVLLGNKPAEAFYQRLGGSPDRKWVPYQMGSQQIDRLANSAWK